MFPRLLLLFPLLLLAGCNVYHPLSGGVGYTDLPIGPNQYEVTFSGTSDTPVAEARWLAMLRSAELSVLRNDPYFEIRDEHVYLSYGAYYFPGGTNAYFYGWYYPFGYGAQPAYMQPYSIPEVSMKVELLPHAGQKTIPAAYLIHEAEHRKIPLSPGVAERAVGMPSEPVSLPPPPTPSTRPTETQPQNSPS
jgi:hypothetical protein